MSTSSPRPSRIHLPDLQTYQSTSSSRLKFLYSDFTRHKHTNPSSYASNIEWWRSTLEVVVSRGWQAQSSTEATNSDKLILHVNGPALADTFRIEGVGKPIGLPGVISELTSSKTYFPLSQFLTSPQSIYDPGWLPYRIASYVVGKPLWWALQQLDIVGDDTGGHAGNTQQWSKVKGDYVVLSLLERAAEAVIQRQQAKLGVSLTESLFNVDTLKREFATTALEDVTLSDNDIKVLLKFLERDKQAIIVQQGVIKFVEPGESAEITAVDVGLLELKNAVANLEASTERIQEQIDDRNRKIAEALRQKRKEVALSHLRARKQLADVQTKRLGSLDTLHSTLMRVEASAGDVQIMKVYESSTATLRAVLAHPLLQRDRVDETMEELATANADAKDIDDAIRIGIDVSQIDAVVDDAELEDELSRLIMESDGERVKAEEKKAKQAEEDKATEDIQRKLQSLALSTPATPPAASLVPADVEERLHGGA